MIQPELLFHFILEGLWLARWPFFHFSTVTAKYKQTSHTIRSTLSHGPIAIAILAWQNSMVFHSLDKMTSFYIHIMPPLTCYMQVLLQSCFFSSITKQNYVDDVSSKETADICQL